MSSVGEVIRTAAEGFEATEAGSLLPLACEDPSIAAIGSVATKALASPLLREQLAERSIEPRSYVAYADADELFGRHDWTLALVLSPFKRDVGKACEALTAGARLSGVVDTVLQDGRGRRTGVNTNATGAAWAVRYLMGGARPGRCLIAGTGASARSCLVGLRGAYGELEVGVVGRNPARTAVLAEEFSVPVVEDIEPYAPDLVINTTTVGETRDDGLGFPLEKALTAGTRYFDLNNRTSALQVQALKHGCVIMSGILMQTVVNTLRVHLLARKSQNRPPDDPSQSKTKVQ